MTNASSKKIFFESEDADLLRDELAAMVKSPNYNTKPIYSTTEPEGSQFIERHMNYMSDHRTMNHHQYISNLKLKTKINK